MPESPRAAPPPLDPDATVLRPAAPPPLTDTQATERLSRPVFDDDATLIRPAKPNQPLPPLPAQPQLPLALPPGYRLHEYRIDALLGQGGFGITYLATDVNLNAKVAIKEYLPAQFAQRAQDSTVRPRATAWLPTLLEGLEQFLVEARTLATFRHPNIVRVARFFEANRTAYMVLDYERGQTLHQWWREAGKAPRSRLLPGRGHSERAPLEEAELLLLLAPLLDGLDLVHRSGVLHRDIKPDNLCVREEDGSLVLLDFGAARPARGMEVPDAPQVLTPGYAPIEQYSGLSQGPWTDLYALAATLYWMVTGKRPLEAPLRQAKPDAHQSAEQLGAERWSREFLRAIDWGLQLKPEDRPQSVAAFRQALFAAHSGSLGLQEALAAGTAAPAARAGWQGPRRWSPAAWPFAWKMGAALVLAALLPMSLSGLYNYRQSVAALAAAEQRSLEQLASATAGRLAQLLQDSRRVAAFLAEDAEVQALLEAPPLEQPPDARALLLRRLASLVATNPDLHLITLMDGKGEALVSTAPEVVGGNYGFRDYYRQAMAGQAATTSIIIGAVAGRAGAYLAQPVRSRAGPVVGAVVLRLRAETIGSLVDAARTPSREPFLVDGDGVLIHHRDLALRFRSLAPLSAEQQAAIKADQRFRRDRVADLAMPDLARALVGARREGHASYTSTVSKTEEVAGFAPVEGHDWVVGVTETHDSFEAPLRRVFHQVLLGLAAVGLLSVLVALAFARSIVRPIRRLTEAAEALKRGDYDAAQVRVTRSDEIGLLGRTFNVMIDVLRQRERERVLRNSERR
ncbi:protein kinase domain-containing protein [Inhella proteolytica]|uniref:HAMP domain-containing protein n=1 Tax=Inhella proteolytica TaxID=2795029 RepID=A0A931J3W5_9BURK|nr:cache domain-containing protein [Inhella proteolytica]MBH9576417.1 HAMP domain-containing protein [Inhella proteolytica]